MEIAMKVLTNFSDFYIKTEDIQKSKRVVSEMEKLEEEFHAAYETAREYLDSRKDDRSSVASDIISIDMLQRMNISEHSETSRKEEMGTEQNVHQKAVEEVGTSSSIKNTFDYMPVTAEIPQSYRVHMSNENEFNDRNIHVENQWTNCEQESQCQYEQPKRGSAMNNLVRNRHECPRYTI